MERQRVRDEQLVQELAIKATEEQKLREETAIKFHEESLRLVQSNHTPPRQWNHFDVDTLNSLPTVLSSQALNYQQNSSHWSQYPYSNSGLPIVPTVVQSGIPVVEVHTNQGRPTGDNARIPQQRTQPLTSYKYDNVEPARVTPPKLGTGHPPPDPPYSESETDSRSSSSSMSIYSSASKARRSKVKPSTITSPENLAKAIGYAIAEASQQTLVATVTPRKKAQDASLLMNIKSDEVYLQGLNALPNNLPRPGNSSDLAKLPVFDDSLVIVTVLNQVFDFCTARMFNHQQLLSIVQGLLIFSEGAKIIIREWMSKLDTSQFVHEDDPEDDRLSPSVTRMLIHIIRRLCKDFYVKPKQTAEQMLNSLTAYDFHSVDLKQKPSFLHFNNLIPYVTTALATADEYSRSDKVILSIVEGIIQRSGHLMNEYSQENSQYQPDWAPKGTLDRCRTVLGILSTRAKDTYNRDSPTAVIKYNPPVYAATIHGYVKNQVVIPFDDHRRTRKEHLKGHSVKMADEDEERIEQAATDFSVTVLGNSLTLGVYAPNHGYFSETPPSESEVDDHFDMTVNSGPISEDRKSQVCTMCGGFYHLEDNCHMRSASKFPKQRNPLAVWKYAGIKNGEHRQECLQHIRERGFWSGPGPDLEDNWLEFCAIVERGAAEEAAKAAIRREDWIKKNPVKHAKQEADRAAKMKGRGGYHQKAHYAPSGGTQPV